MPVHTYMLDYTMFAFKDLKCKDKLGSSPSLKDQVNFRSGQARLFATSPRTIRKYVSPEGRKDACAMPVCAKPTSSTPSQARPPATIFCVEGPPLPRGG
ncbi:unnamed protein product, partial [Mesorhabditis spiculigera]